MKALKNKKISLLAILLVPILTISLYMLSNSFLTRHNNVYAAEECYQKLDTLSDAEAKQCIEAHPEACMYIILPLATDTVMRACGVDPTTVTPTEAQCKSGEVKSLVIVKTCIDRYHLTADEIRGSGGGPAGPTSFPADCENIGYASGHKDECSLTQSIVKVVVNVLSAVVGLAIIISIIIAGIQYTTANGNQQSVAAAKNRLAKAAVALALYIFGFGLLNWLIPGGLLK